MDVVAGASARGLRKFDWLTVFVCLAELHWYEAAGIGRKEYKIEHLL
jgi:hypothetical protein